MQFGTGQVLTPKKSKGIPCPKCNDKVLDSFPTGFVDEFDVIVQATSRGFKVQENWHCPNCGFWERKHHYIDQNGLRIEPHTESTKHTDTWSFSTKPSDSSDKPKKKRKART